MERLTVFDGEFWIHKNFPPVEEDRVDEFIDCVKELAARLAAIEDILGDEYELDDQKTAMWCKETVGMAFSEDTAPVERLRELWFADKDGRCVVLPCKVEDDVYINIFGRTLPFTVISISQMASTPTFKAQHGIRLVYIFKADDVGETVFMTREEAEAALAKIAD